MLVVAPIPSFKSCRFLFILVGIVDCFFLPNPIQQPHDPCSNENLLYCGQFRRIDLFLSPIQQQYPTNTNLKANELLSSTSLDRNDWNRRRVITTTATTILTTIPSWPQTADSTNVVVSNSNTNTATVSTALNCLLDLPSYDPTTTVRLFLCRHGETDYNRNNIIQGARIDPPINDMGKTQAKLLGQTLYRTILQQSTTSTNNPRNVLIVHSPLVRAKQTAEIVAEQVHSAVATSKNSSLDRISSTLLLQPLDALKEIDFGSVAEGAPVQEYRSELLTLYSSWAVGNYNARMTAGGESGIEVRYKRLYICINLGEAFHTPILICDDVFLFIPL